MDETIGSLIRGRTEFYSVSASATIREASRYMAERNIGAVAIRDEAGKFCGVFSERDLLKRVVAAGLDLDSARVTEVMSTTLATAHPNESCLTAAERMKSSLTRHLVVLDERGQFLGMVSQSDLIKAYLRQTEEERDLYKHYAFPETPL
jgi:CBS domain-containing protein